MGLKIEYGCGNWRRKAGKSSRDLKAGCGLVLVQEGGHGCREIYELGLIVGGEILRWGFGKLLIAGGGGRTGDWGGVKIGFCLCRSFWFRM